MTGLEQASVCAAEKEAVPRVQEEEEEEDKEEEKKEEEVEDEEDKEAAKCRSSLLEFCLFGRNRQMGNGGKKKCSRERHFIFIIRGSLEYLCTGKGDTVALQRYLW